jgi:hypothetical protein
MNILKQNPRRSIIRKIHLEYLDHRIVPSTVQPAMAAASEVATAHATLNAAAANGESATADSKVQNHEIKREIRHENRIIKLEERHEAAKDRRHALLEKLAARRAVAHHISSAVMVPTTQGTPVVVSFGRHQNSIGSGSVAADPSTGSPAPVMPITTTPGTTSSGTASSGTTSSGTTSSATGSTGTTTTTTNPLPDNVSVLLDTVYQEYENGDLPTTTNQPGQVEIQGSNVGVQLRASNSADFDTMLAQAESLGLQVTTSSAAYDMVVGFLPIAELPAASQLPGNPSIVPLLYPTNNGSAMVS